MKLLFDIVYCNEIYQNIISMYTFFSDSAKLLKHLRHMAEAAATKYQEN
jgi:hypothetical protein